MITRDNYEIWFIDYLDGRLNPLQISQLMVFLKENADLAAELEGLGETFLVAEQISFEAKDYLKEISQKALVINNNNFDDLCIARIEGDLNAEQRKEFERYLFTHPEKINDYGLYAKTRLQPDYNVIYDKKSSLKKYSIKNNYRKYFIPAVGIAASVILLILAYFYMNDFDAIKEKQIAEIIEKNESYDSIQKLNNAEKSSLTDKNKQVQQKEKIYKIERTNEKRSVAEYQTQKENLLISDSLKNKTENKQGFILIEKIESRKSLLAYTENELPELELRAATYFFPVIENRKTDEKPTFAQLAKIQVRKIFMKQEDRLNEPSFTFLDVAEAALRSFNKRTGKNIRIEKTYNEQGSVEVLAFKSENFQIIKSVKK